MTDTRPNRPHATLRASAGPIVALLVGAVATAIARTALLPGLWFWDTAEAQIVGPTLGVMHPTGFPAYVILGWLASVALTPFGDPAFRMHLLSAILVGIAAAASVGIGRRLDVPLPVAAAAGIGLALTPVVWRIGTHADVHALHLALVALLLLLLLGWERAFDAALAADEEPGRADRWIVAAAVVFGVSLAGHQLTLLLAVPVAAYVLAVDPDLLRRPRLVVGCLATCLGVATLIYLEMPLRAGPFPAALVYGHPDTWEGMRYILLAEQFRGALENPFGDPAATMTATTYRLATEFGLLLVLLPFAFVATAVRAPRYALLSGLATGITLLFNASYQNADIGRYDLGPVLMLWTWLAVLATVALEAVVDRLYGPVDDEIRSRALTGLGVAAGVALLVVPVADIGPRFAAVDRSTDRSAAEWMERTFTILERDAVVVSWWSYSTPLWYGQLIEGRRPDVRVIDDRTRLDEGLGEVTDVIDAHLGRAPVYVMRATVHELAEVDARYDLELVDGTDVLYRVIPPAGAGA